MKTLIINLRCFITRLVEKYPAAVALCGTLCGILLSGDYGMVGVLVVVLGMAISLLLPRFRMILFYLFICAGVGAILVNNYFSRSALPKIGNGILEARVIDAACGGTQNRWLTNPSLLTVIPIRYRLDNAGWQPGQGKIALQLPRNNQRFSYGDMIRLDGNWLDTAAKPVIRTLKLIAAGQVVDCNERPLPGFNFQYYLRTRGIHRRFQAKQVTVLRHENSLLATLMEGRNILLAATVKGIKSNEQRGMLAALLFGCKQGLPRTSRRTFIYSGTIHIFAVSGLHVGMLALLLLWCFRRVSFSFRHLLIPGLLLLYVISTGLHPPALRAWLMITIWCVCRALLLKMPALNIIFITATLLLLFNPLYLGDAGSQFSFIVVGFLIASAGRINRFLQLLFEKWNWIPVELHSGLAVQRIKWLRWGIASLLGCMVAWLASSGIALYYQGVYVPTAVLANFLIMPLVWLLFIIVGFRFIAIVCTFMIPLFNGALSLLINLTAAISEFFYRYLGSIPTPHPKLCSLLLFYLAGVGLVSGKKRLTLIIAALVMLGTLIFWHSSTLFAKPSLFIIHGGKSQVPVLIFSNPQQNTATVVNVPSWQAAGIIRDCLRDKGITRIRQLVISGSGKKFCNGISRLLKSMDSEQLIIPASLRSRYVRAAVKAAVDNNTVVIQLRKTDNSQLFKRSDLTVKLKKMRVSIDYHSLSGNINVEICNNGLGTRKLIVTGKYAQQYKAELLNCNKVAITELIIDQ